MGKHCSTRLTLRRFNLHDKCTSKVVLCFRNLLPTCSTTALHWTPGPGAPAQQRRRPLQGCQSRRRRPAGSRAAAAPRCLRPPPRGTPHPRLQQDSIRGGCADSLLPASILELTSIHTCSTSAKSTIQMSIRPLLQYQLLQQLGCLLVSHEKRLHCNSAVCPEQCDVVAAGTSVAPVAPSCSVSCAGAQPCSSGGLPAGSTVTAALMCRTAGGTCTLQPSVL